MDRKETVELKDGRLLGFAEYGDPKGLPIFYFHGTPGSHSVDDKLDQWMTPLVGAFESTVEVKRLC